MTKVTSHSSRSDTHCDWHDIDGSVEGPGLQDTATALPAEMTRQLRRLRTWAILNHSINIIEMGVCGAGGMVAFLSLSSCTDFHTIGWEQKPESGPASPLLSSDTGLHPTPTCPDPTRGRPWGLHLLPRHINSISSLFSLSPPRSTQSRL